MLTVTQFIGMSAGHLGVAGKWRGLRFGPGLYPTDMRDLGYSLKEKRWRRDGSKEISQHSFLEEGHEKAVPSPAQPEHPVLMGGCWSSPEAA